ncbi:MULTISPECIES: hypothetical protein [unclassified Microcoleus]|uniref:hypothetical protein n=1 Tax=unclassified Microcoleus TaxID=2642155 RepID=UPI002FD0AFFD
MERIPNDALVVRGGRNRPEDIKSSTATHPSGITGISVECAVGLSVAELAVTIAHGQVGVTTVGEVRSSVRWRCHPYEWPKSKPCNINWLNTRTSKSAANTNNS